MFDGSTFKPQSNDGKNNIKSLIAHFLTAFAFSHRQYNCGLKRCLNPNGAELQ